MKRSRHRTGTVSPVPESRILTVRGRKVMLDLGHSWASIDPGGIEYLVFRIDPEHVLALSN